MILDPPVMPIDKFSPRRSIIVITFCYQAYYSASFILHSHMHLHLKEKRKNMKKLHKTLNFFAVALILSLNLSSQEEEILLNEDFLDSLPEETKADLVEQLDADRDKLREFDYGVFDTMMSKSSAERFIDQELLRSEVDVAPEEITR